MMARHKRATTPADWPRVPGSGPVPLICESCRTRSRDCFSSYEEWQRAAKALNWFIGLDLVLCDRCAGCW